MRDGASSRKTGPGFRKKIVRRQNVGRPRRFNPDASRLMTEFGDRDRAMARMARQAKQSGTKRPTFLGSLRRPAGLLATAAAI